MIERLVSHFLLVRQVGIQERTPCSQASSRRSGDPVLPPLLSAISDTLLTLRRLSGTRNCIGKNLAYAETQLILAKLLYHFDLSAGDKLDTDSWFDQKSWAIRWKKPVWVKLKIAEPND